MKVALLVVVAAIVGAVVADPWDSNNDPAIFGSYNAKFSALPASGTLKVKPWSDTYWPSFESGIAHRWNSDDPQDFNYTLASLATLKTYSPDDMAALSPAEKVDIFASRYDYPTVKAEWKRTSPTDETWEGLCHGWSPASLFYTEPSNVTLVNRDGLTVYFGASDVKALLIYWVAMYEQQQQVYFAGDRCKYDIEADPSHADDPACADINAGTFHILITNLIGLKGVGFVADVDRSIQVWNQPIHTYSYRSKIHGSSVLVNLNMVYTKELMPNWTPDGHYDMSFNYQYNLTLDQSGSITGGDWVTWKRTDFHWNQAIGAFYGTFGKTVSTIYQAAQQSAAVRAVAPHRAAGRRTAAIHSDLFTSEGRVTSPAPANNMHATWRIAPAAGASTIIIRFKEFATERNVDIVRIFEGADGDGFLVAALSGDQLPADVEVNASGAFIEYTTDRSNPSRGFVAVYNSH